MKKLIPGRDVPETPTNTRGAARARRKARKARKEGAPIVAPVDARVVFNGLSTEDMMLSLYGGE